MTDSENSGTAQTSSPCAPNTGSSFAVGQSVVAAVDLIEPPDEEFPAMLYAEIGDELIVRALHQDGRKFPVSVSHPNVFDRSFGVRVEEIKPSIPQGLSGAECSQRVAPGNTSTKTETHMRY